MAPVIDAFVKQDRRFVDGRIHFPLRLGFRFGLGLDGVAGHRPEGQQQNCRDG